MTELIDTSGPAFPVAGNPVAPDGLQSAGMSLRQWFAGMALPVVLKQQMESASEAIKVAFSGNVPSQKDMDELGEFIRKQTAENCFRIADALIAAGKEPTP